MPEKKFNLRLTTWLCLTLGLITLALYLPSLKHGFLTYDDQHYVTENLRVQEGLTLPNLIWAFGYHAGNWHPLTWLSHMLDCQLYGLNPAGHHLTNSLLHACNTLLLFLVLNFMTGAIWRSFLVAALFAWHPLHVESVAWVAERKDVLSAFFWMLTLGSYCWYTTRPSVIRYVSTLLLFVLGLMAKPMVVTLPFVLLLMDFWPLKRLGTKRSQDFESDKAFPLPRPLRWQYLILEKSPFLLLTFIGCMLTISAQEEAIVSTSGLPVSQRISHAIVSYSHYLGATFLPRNLAIFYPYELSKPILQIAFAGVLWAAVTLLAICQVRRRPYLIVGWFWFLGTLVPVIGFVQVGEQAWADRYTYIPLVGIFVALTWAAVDAFGCRLWFRTGVMLVGFALLIATTAQLRHWKDTRTLFSHTAKVTRNNHMAITMLGSLLAKEGKLTEAIEHYQTALQYKPGYPEAHFFLGNALDQQGKLDEAIANYTKALRFKPTREPAHIFLGIAFGKLNQYEDATSHYQAALKLNPDSAVAHNNFARLLHTQGQLDEAIKHYSAALKLDPELAQAHNNLGILLLQKGRLVEGIAQLREAMRLNPENPESQYNLALALNQQEQWREAAELFSKTVSAASPDPNAHYQFGLALVRQQRTREAMGRFAQAILLKPTFPDALAALSWILATDPNPELRHGAEAVRMAEQACELTDRKDPEMLIALAAAYAEVSRFEEATATAYVAQSLAAQANRPDLVAQCENMLVNFRSAKRWR